MSNINFVPDDYVQSNESRRALVNAKMTRMQESITKFEELQTRRKEMMRTALTTAELIEPVPRSVVLASLTNNLPAGVSLVKLTLIQKEPRSESRRKGSKSRYQAAKQTGSSDAGGKIAGERQLDTQLTIEGMAPSDLQVASYIEQLGVASLVENVALVESKEKKIDDISFRNFKLTAVLSKEIHLTKEDVDDIKAKAEHSMYHF